MKMYHVLWKKVDPKTTSVLIDKDAETRKSKTLETLGGEWHEAKVIINSGNYKIYGFFHIWKHKVHENLFI